MNINIKTTSLEFCKYLFDIINAFSPDLKKITPAEAELLSHFLLLPPKFEHKRFSAVAKKQVTSSTGFSTLNINNKLHSLTEKGYLYRDTDGVLYPRKAISQAINSFLKDSKFNFNITINASV